MNEKQCTTHVVQNLPSACLPQNIILSTVCKTGPELNCLVQNQIVLKLGLAEDGNGAIAQSHTERFHNLITMQQIEWL